MSASGGVNAQSSAGYVLHRYPYRETSLIIESFTRAHGRIAMVARGAKRASAASKHALHPFQPLTLSWFGRAEMKTLKASEQERVLPQMRGSALLSAFYVNELLLRLSHREDPHERLYDAYEAVIDELTFASMPTRESGRAVEVALRRFEMTLLSELGYALRLDEEADTHKPLDPSGLYTYVLERGPISARGSENPHHLPTVRGETLLNMAHGEFADALALQEAKQLMRRALNHLLGDKSLHTRQLIRELR